MWNKDSDVTHVLRISLQFNDEIKSRNYTESVFNPDWQVLRSVSLKLFWSKTEYKMKRFCVFPPNVKQHQNIGTFTERM